MVSKENHVVTLEYTIKNDAELLAHEENLQQISMNNKPSDYEIIADKRDYLIAASCGLLAGLIDVFWVADFSLEKAQTWGREQTGQFVVAVAKMTGYQKDDLSGAIKHLEKQYCIPSDKLTPTFGGGLQHHLRDFSHHASLGGLLFSILSQFTGKAYGTNTVGEFTIVPFQDTSLIGTTIQEKLFNGVVVWFLHLVSDVDGTSKTAGRGTGIPGPILSFAKELSILPGIKQATIPYKGNRIPFSVWIL